MPGPLSTSPGRRPDPASAYFDHTIRETEQRKVDALVYVGDSMEEEADQLCGHAGKLGSLGTPIFVFQEGDDSKAAACFRQMASLSRGAYLAFDLAGIGVLKQLLAAVAVFATGGRAALEHYAKRQPEVLQLTSQLRS